MTTTVVAYTSFCDGHVTRFSSLRTSLRNKRMRSMRPPVASLTVSSVVVSAMVDLLHYVLTAPASTRPPPRCAASFSGQPSREGWQARRESNPQPPVLETGALPIELLAYHIADWGLRIADLLRIVAVKSAINPHSAIRNPQSLTLPVGSVFATEAAELGKLQPLGRLLLVLRRAVIAPLALSARERDDVSHGYSMISVTVPAPTVRPPSRMAKRAPFSSATGAISSPLIVVLSPGITISTPSGKCSVPVTSVVRM